LAEISAKDVKALRDSTGAGMMDCKKALGDAQGDVEKAVELLRERGLSKAGKRAGRATSEGAIGLSLKAGVGVIIELGCETDFVARNDQFQTLLQEVADAIAGAGAWDSLDAALEVKLGKGTVATHIQEAVGVVGENIQLKRVAGLRVDGAVDGYIHAGGKLGVVVGFETANPGDLGSVGRDVAMHVAAVDPTPVSVDRTGVDTALLEKERTILRNQALQSGKPEKIVDSIVAGRINKFYKESCLVEQDFVKDPDKTVGQVLKEAGDVTVSGFVRFRVGEAAEQ
jgi:elongation factor Ts